MVPLAVEWLGRVPYREGLLLQERCVEERRAGACGDRLLLLEHPPVVTLGRGSRPEHLLESASALAARGVEIHEISRGGDVTYHAPGQLLGYPIVDLAARGARDVHVFLRLIEASLIDALGTLDLEARRVDGMTGVFVAHKAPGERDRKIASIGIGIRRWISFHGFALNVSVDLKGFDAIVPCGLAQVEMTSIESELVRAGRSVPGNLDVQARAAVTEAFGRRLDT